MNTNNGLPLIAPSITPVLDASFRPPVLANRAFRQEVRKSGRPEPVAVALEQADGNISHFFTEVFAETHPAALGNFTYLERLVKFLLWTRGGYRIHFKGPAGLTERLTAYYRETPTGKFDSNLVGERMFDHPI